MRLGIKYFMIRLSQNAAAAIQISVITRLRLQDRFIQNAVVKKELIHGHDVSDWIVAKLGGKRNEHVTLGMFIL